MGQRFGSNPVVVLGFGAAAVSAVQALRTSGFAGRVTVVTDAGSKPYSPVLTSYYAGGRIGREQCFPWSDLNIGGMVDDLIADASIAALDVAAHEAVLSDGRHIGYSKLLVATGAHPVAPGFPGFQTYEPHVLRTMHDADRLRQALSGEARKRILVAGTSMVGLKVLEACLDRHAAATMLGRSAHILRASAHPSIAQAFEQLLEERGVALRLSQNAVSVEEGGAGRTVHFDNGDAEFFDEVVLAQGVKPNLGFVNDGSVDMRDGIIVDRFMRASVPDVFAAGDVAQALDLSSGENRVIGLWQSAVQQGRCAGAAMAAELAGRVPTRPYTGSIPSNTIHVRDILFASAGSTKEQADRRFDVRETRDATGLFAYDMQDGEERLVGFNMLAVVKGECERNALADELGLYRRKILNSYL